MLEKTPWIPGISENTCSVFIMFSAPSMFLPVTRGLCCGRFVQFLESKLSPEERRGMSVVLERLVQTFLQEERYHNDPRYITHCLRCVGPLAHAHSHSSEDHVMNAVLPLCAGELLQRSHRGVRLSARPGRGDAGGGALYRLGPSVRGERPAVPG